MIHIFIINSSVSNADFGKYLRKHLKERGDIRYFVFNTSHPGMETEMTSRMIKFFDGETIRFYACGGSGTMRNIMQGSGEYKECEFAFYPLGSTNDFLKTFGENEKYFEDIDSLIDGTSKKIDYIRTSHGVALNTVSYGIDANLVSALQENKEFEIFGNRIPLILAYIRSLPTAQTEKLNMVIDNQVYSEEVTELVIGNGSVLGGAMKFTDDANINDGVFDFLFAARRNPIGMLKIIMDMVKGNVKEVRNNTISGKASSFEIRNTDGKKISLNLDGEIVTGDECWKIEIIKDGMNFVFPKEMIESGI